MIYESLKLLLLSLVTNFITLVISCYLCYRLFSSVTIVRYLTIGERKIDWLRNRRQIISKTILGTSDETQINHQVLICFPLSIRNLAISAKTLLIFAVLLGSFNVLLFTTTFSSAFSTVSTSVDQGQISDLASTTTGRGSLFQQIEEFIAPSGYEQAREDPSYAINILFTELGFSQFEPSDISIPANMVVI
jgi:hypothetical protein